MLHRISRVLYYMYYKGWPFELPKIQLVMITYMYHPMHYLQNSSTLSIIAKQFRDLFCRLLHLLGGELCKCILEFIDRSQKKTSEGLERRFVGRAGMSTCRTMIRFQLEDTQKKKERKKKEKENGTTNRVGTNFLVKENCEAASLLASSPRCGSKSGRSLISSSSLWSCRLTIMRSMSLSYSSVPGIIDSMVESISFTC